MKRTWIVRVDQGVGHELHDTHSEMDIYGPFTEAEAKRLEAELNTLLYDPDDDEHMIATAEQLWHLSYREVLKKYRIERRD